MKDGQATVDQVLFAGDEATSAWFKFVSESTQADTELRVALKTEFDHFENATHQLLIVLGCLVVLSVLTWITLIALNRRNVLRERKRFVAFETVIASIGHDFGNPLGAIQEAVLMLSKKYPALMEESTFTRWPIMPHAASSSLVTDIMQVTHGEPLTVEAQNVNIENWFADFVALYASKAQKRSV